VCMGGPAQELLDPYQERTYPERSSELMSYATSMRSWNHEKFAPFQKIGSSVCTGKHGAAMSP
jgi:hypothetical protein